MGQDTPPDITEQLLAWARGDRAHLDRLIPLVAPELRKIAHRQMRREPTGHTLQTSALVNEAYLRLVDVARVEWRDRAHFYGVCANIMRRILVESARSRKRQKRGGGVTVVPMDEEHIASPQPAVEVEALDEALDRLGIFDPQAARIVELRYFGGLTEKETAEVVGVSPRTIRRDWATAKVWLLGELTP